MSDTASTDRTPATGPLTVHPSNPRYFANAEGHPVYLVGSHTWANFQDIGFEGDKPFDYDAYLQFMVEHRFNFMRFWTWEHAAWATWTPEKVIFGPMPYRRTGPGLALDGKPKFDLDQFDEAYFDRMRARLIRARDRGIYAAVMLFQAFSGIWPYGGATHQNDAFRGHYYNSLNNVQSFNGDSDGNSILDIEDPRVRAYQAAYIEKVVDTVNDLDNVIFEIINEGGNEDWDEFVLKTIRRRQETNLQRHPVGITGHGGVKLDGALKSTCDWISPGSNDAPEIKNVVTDPPVWSGAKVSVLDTDHIWGHGIDYRWVWRSFLRGHNVLFMDPWGPLAGWYDPARNSPDYPGYWDGRKAMRVTALCSARIDLAKAVPHPELVSTGFCLANPGKEYLVYVPNGEVNIDLSGSTGSFIAEWIHPIEGTIVAGASATAGSSQSFRTPFAGDAVLFLHRP